MAIRAALLARNTLLNVLGQTAPLLVAVVAVPYIVTALGHDRFGVLALTWAVLGYFGVLDLGFGRAATRFVADALGRREEREVPRVLATAVLVQAGAGILAAAALAAAAPWLAGSVLSVPAPLVGETAGALRVVALALPAVIATGSVRGALEAAQRFDLITAVAIPAGTATFLLPLLGAAFGWGLPGIVALLLVGRVATLIALGALAWRHVPGLPAPLRPDRTALRRMLGFGGWVMASNLTIPLLSHLERFLIPALLTVSALTYYAVPFEVLVRLAVVPTSMAMALYPAFSYVQRRDARTLDELLSRPLKYLLLVMTPLLACVGLFADVLLTAWMGADFAAQATTPLRILVVVFYLSSLAQIPFVAVQALGRPDLKAKLDFFQVPFFALLLLVLIPRWGITGAAAAKLVLTVVDVVALFLFVRLVHPPPASRGGAGVVKRIGAASGVFVAFALAARLAWEPLPAAVAFAALCVGYVAWFYARAIDARDRAALAAGFGRRG